MTEVTVIGTLDKVIIGATGITEIIQNVKTILSTRRGSVPGDRAFGVDGNIVDQPLIVARARGMADIVETVEKYEPRVRVKKVEWRENVTDAMDGRLVPAVTIEIEDP